MWRLEVEARPEQVPAVRRAAVDAARSAGLPPRRVDDVALCVSEVASNCVRHADAGRPGTVLLLIEHRADVLVVTLGDTGQGMGGTRRARGDEALGMGIGLALVFQLADQVEVTTSGGGTEVRLRFLLPRPPAPDARARVVRDGRRVRRRG